MAYYSIFPETDTTLYSFPDRTDMNTGHDEILELVKERGTGDSRYYPSRILIKFKNEEITNTISNIIGHSNFNTITTCNLELFSTEHKNLASVLNIDAFPVAKTWDEGTGRYSNKPTSSNGASWLYRDNSTIRTLWVTGSTVAGSTFASSSITLNEIPSGSQTQLTINNIDYIAVLSSSLFNNSSDELYFNIGDNFSKLFYIK